MLKVLVLCSVNFCKFLVFLGMNFRRRELLKTPISCEDAFGRKSLFLKTCLWWKQEAQNKQSEFFTCLWLRCFYAPVCTGSSQQHSGNIDPDPGPEHSPVTVQWMCGCKNCFWVVIYSKFIIQTYQRLLIENLDFCDNLIIQVEIIGKMQKGTYHKDNCVNHPCLTLKCLPSVRYAHIFMKAHVDRS